MPGPILGLLPHCVCLSCFLWIGLICDKLAGNELPNIVFIMADDLGWSDLGCYGADLIETPNIDRLASQGMRFTDAYAMSVCSPTRSTILTGRHAARLHITIWSESADRPPQNQALIPPTTIPHLSTDFDTLAKALQDMGYATAHVGKWHLGSSRYYPEAHGFDVNIGATHWGAPDTFWHPFSGQKYFKSDGFRYVPGLGFGKPGDYLTDRFTDKALEIIDACQDRPFYLQLHFHAPHTPIEAKPERVEYYRQKLRPEFHHANPTYAAMVHTVDENVGRVMRRLDDLGLSNNTLVVFTSDNGGFVNKADGLQVTDNSPLRSGKGSLYEGGVRVPCIMRWPERIQPASRSSTPITTMDFFPTFCASAGVEAARIQAAALDGLSLLDLFQDPTVRLDRDALYFHYPHYYATTTPASAIRSGDWKLIHYYDQDRDELYDLSQDLGESQDLSGAQPAVVESLRKNLDEWLQSVDAQFPVRNPSVTP